jgi:hypothetical protein
MKTTPIISRENVLCNVLNITEECAALANVYSVLSEYLTPTGDSFLPFVSIKKRADREWTVSSQMKVLCLAMFLTKLFDPNS